ncbi:hypothetical protein [Spiroplasma endosymbiont of Phyllotreta cruciferae]|uniref:hypothetical protein n=1 Tax=Spiroplasma endosymbiont of Phyllotreta cruciferae TaxID=2886375 RepID=UPI00209E688F|nr:hypothetical protein [Spiroplasma endosymbiont of Phyllotreta cruciferae]
MRLYQDYVNKKMIWNNDVPYSSNIGSYTFYVASFLIITGVTLLINSKSMFKYNNHKNQNFNQVNYFFNIIL